MPYGYHWTPCPGGKNGISLGGLGVLAAALVAIAKRHAIEHGAAEVAHVLVLVAIAGASITVATVAVVGAVLIRRRLRRIERATGKTQGTLTSYTVRELPEPRAELPAAKADLPAAVFIHPTRNRGGR